MNAKQTKIIAALNAELAAALATKAAALEDADGADVFYAACDRIRELEDQIWTAGQSRRKSYACPVLADLVAMNID